MSSTSTNGVRSETRKQPPAVAEPEDDQGGWSPAMTLIVAVVVAFFLGLFVGEELLHRPQVRVAPPSAQATAPDMAENPSGDTSTTDTTPPPSPVELAALKTAINTENDPERLVQLAEAHVERRPEIAVLAFQKAIRLGDHKPRVYRGLAVAYLSLGENNQAASNLRTALKLDPKDITAHVALALALEKQPNGKAAARAELQKALALNPPDTLKANIQTALSRLGS